jgi:hypothetical protein
MRFQGLAVALAQRLWPELIAANVTMLASMPMPAWRTPLMALARLPCSIRRHSQNSIPMAGERILRSILESHVRRSTEGYKGNRKGVGPIKFEPTRGMS